MSQKRCQEHCILLCNYFNYIDRLRRERVGGATDSELDLPSLKLDLPYVFLVGKAYFQGRTVNSRGRCSFQRSSYELLEGDIVIVV